MQLISGIQQVGIGVASNPHAKAYYSSLFGMSALVFDEKAEAPLMTDYTGGVVQSRYASLTLNMKGGGGFEVWQYTSRTPQPAATPVKFGDLGTFSVKMKTPDIQKAHAHFSKLMPAAVTAIAKAPDETAHFWLTDQYGNIFNIVEEHTDWFSFKKGVTGGVAGAVICVSSIQKSLDFYKNAIGLSLVYQTEDSLEDIPFHQPDGKKYKRVLLKKEAATEGAFSEMLGGIQIELIEFPGAARKIFANRFWGDLGFIHLCFDVLNMPQLKEKIEAAGYPFVIDSKDSFAMEGAAGRFCYVEDPDGTLIELVETHKVPILKKYNWFLDLTKRKKNKPLPKWMVRMLGLSKVKPA